ncbi:MAG: hypothetical protein QOG85_335 [Gaiellaceae bacterium]|jgi:hypothetical protein|nr:hypothetical protein [Gaiellaceae bacterium]
MTDHISFPPLHDPAPGELEKRKQHLLSEIEQRPERRLPLPAAPRLRVAALAGAAIAVAAGAGALSIALGGASSAKAASLLVRTASGKTISVPASSPTAATTEVVGGTPSEQELMRDIVAGMQPSVIEKIAIVDSGNDVALHFTFTGQSPEAFWEDSLVAAAFRDRAQAAGEDLSVTIYDGVAFGAAPPPGLTSLPPAQPGDAAAARQAFEDAAAEAGVSFESLTIYEPDGIAVAATFTSDDPAPFLVHQMRSFLAALGTDTGDFDGTYISLVDGSGQTVWEAWWNRRAAEGSVGSTPDLAGCSPVTHSWGAAPPACPAS